MKQSLKKGLTLLLVMILLLDPLPASAYASDVKDAVRAEEHVHDWVAGETVPASCTDTGSTVYVCSCGEKKVETLDALGHAWGEWGDVVEPTCAETGSRTHKCERCGEAETETIDALGHAWGEWGDVVEPTCTETGSRTHVCERCDKSETETIDALGHAWGEWGDVVEPTCAETGSHTHKCERCGETETETIDALGHAWGESFDVIEPTCAETGSHTHKCERCGETETETIDALGHAWGEWGDVVEPTCAETGSHTHKCERCGETETETIDALGHAWGESFDVIEPTCAEAGSHTHVCERCGETETEALDALGHAWGEWSVLKEATKTEPGEREHTCERCGETEKEEIPVLPSEEVTVVFLNGELEVASVRITENTAIGDKLPGAPETAGDLSFRGWFDEENNMLTAETVITAPMTVRARFWFRPASGVLSEPGELCVTLDGVRITVEAPEGVFPDEARLWADRVTEEQQAAVDAAVADERSGDRNVAASFTFDIKILDAEGAELQPADDQKVKVSFTLAAVGIEGLSTEVYHMEEQADGALSAEALEVETRGKEATVETDGFSAYHIEITYNKITYVVLVPDDGSSPIVPLQDILDFVGVTVPEGQTVTSVRFGYVDNNGVWIDRPGEVKVLTPAQNGGAWAIQPQTYFTATDRELRVSFGNDITIIISTESFQVRSYRNPAPYPYGGTLAGIVQGGTDETFMQNSPLATVCIDRSKLTYSNAIVTINDPNPTFTYTRYNFKTDAQLETGTLTGGSFAFRPTSGDVHHFGLTGVALPRYAEIVYSGSGPFLSIQFPNAAILPNGTRAPVVMSFSDLVLYTPRSRKLNGDLIWNGSKKADGTPFVFPSGSTPAQKEAIREAYNDSLAFSTSDTFEIAYLSDTIDGDLKGVGVSTNTANGKLPYAQDVMVNISVPGAGEGATFYYAQEDIDITRWEGNTQSACYGSADRYCYSEQMLVYEAGLASDIYIPDNKQYQCGITKEGGAFLFSSNRSDAETLYAGFAVLVNAQQGITIRVTGAAPPSGGVNSPILPQAVGALWSHKTVVNGTAADNARLWQMTSTVDGDEVVKEIEHGVFAHMGQYVKDKVFTVEETYLVADSADNYETYWEVWQGATTANDTENAHIDYNDPGAATNNPRLVGSGSGPKIDDGFSIVCSNTVTFKNERLWKDLTVSKTVPVARTGDENREWTFTLQVWDSENNERAVLTDLLDYAKNKNDSSVPGREHWGDQLVAHGWTEILDGEGKGTGVYTFKLKGGEQTSISLPIGCKYVLEEEADAYYYQSVSSLTGDTVTNDHKVDGVWTGDPIPTGTGVRTITDSNFRNDTTAAYTNMARINLTVAKIVSGNQASRNKFFKFSVQITGCHPNEVLTLDMTNAVLAPSENGATVYSAAEMAVNSRDDDPDTPGQQILCSENGAADVTIYLQHGNSAGILGLSYGASYTVTETPEDYLPSLTITGDTKTGDSATDAGTPIGVGNNVRAASDSFLAEDATLTFTNTRGGIVPTGVVTDSRGALILMLLGADLILTILYLGKKRRRYG